MSFDSTSSKKVNFDRANNFMRQFRDPDSRELKKLSANQFMEVWSHYDRDGNGYIEGTELDGFLKEFVSSANFIDVSPDMKLVLLLTVLAVVASGFTNSASLDYSSSRANLYLGYIGAGDRLLASSTVQKRAIANTIQSQDVAYYGNVTTRISAIRAVEIGMSQRARPRLISGGIGWRNATVRLETIRGGGFNYRVEFWGR
ncbi:Calbindin-32 [Papilio xuthus]|uniref:Calbindin-32 n=2 Tax=Papilio xuthus TaxID=66420 RepID=A0A194Q5K5_PAPXU|nr:Calbindin-32 [Papilio xuthus]